MSKGNGRSFCNPETQNAKVIIQHGSRAGSFICLIPKQMSSMNKTISQKLISLKQSRFRSKFKLTRKDRDYIATKGLQTIKEHAFQFVYSRIAPDFPKNDGKQTPMRGHPVFIAQHATATCCRGCIKKWHGIEKGRALNVKDVDFIVALIMDWIEEQLTGRSPITPS